MTPSNGLLLNPWSFDMYAPSWAGVTPQLPGFCDVDFDYPMSDQPGSELVYTTVTLAPGQKSFKNQIVIDSDADYLSREIYIAPVGGSTGPANPQDLKMRLSDGDGNFITSDWCTANDLCGPVGPVPLPFRKGTVAYVDLWNQGTATLIVQVGLKGFKRFPCADTQAPIPAYRPISSLYCREQPGQTFEEFEYFFEFSNGSSPLFAPWVQNLQPYSPNIVFRQLPLRIDNDADFLWRGTTGMIMAGGGGVAQAPQEFFLKFYDNAIIDLAKDIIRPAGYTPQRAPLGCEMVLSNGGGRMAPHFPEIFIPRGGAVNVDILLQTQSPPTAIESVSFSLRGFKLYSEAACNI